MPVLQTAGRFFRRYPSVFGSLLFLVLLYKYFFGWFTVLLATSPIFVFAGFFLGIILAYGEPNIPENDHVYKKIENAYNRNVHDSGKSIGGVTLPRILSSEERLAKRNNNGKITKKKYHSGSSSSESGSGESDGSETDTHPMLHSFHHLRSAESSSRSSQDGDSNDSSIEDETDNQEGKDDNEHKEKNGKVVAWTADDQKNILNIGCLEIERNQRLESLIARRRARKYVDRNLIDFGSSDSLPTIEELSKFNVQIPAIFAPRKNPFDLPYNEENFPESAPSAPLKMLNKFDLPFEQVNESSSTSAANSSHVDSTPVLSQSQRDTMFRRHESFTQGAPFLSDFWQDMQPSRFKPYFVTEKMANEGIPVSNLDGEASEKSSVEDSDSTSSVTDQESHKLVLEESSNQNIRPPLSQMEEQFHPAQNVREVPLALDIEPPLLISDSSDDDISLPGGNINDWEEAQGSGNLNSSQNGSLEDPSVIEYPHEMEMTSNEFHQLSPHSDDIDSLSSSTEATEPSELNNIEQPAKEVEFIDEIPIADPVYDSSPSGSEKPASVGSAIDAVLLQEGNTHTSDVEVGMEGEDSPARIDAHSTEIALPSLASVPESKLREKETSEVREQSNTGHDGSNQDPVSHANPTAPDISSKPTTSSSSNGKFYD
uniref:Tyrosinase copper-binding domain-containing protein n=1 Tax=Leersia perrieri TaxID=77586 RepID=A0A0D9WYP6_9ORYZ